MAVPSGLPNATGGQTVLPRCGAVMWRRRVTPDADGWDRSRTGRALAMSNGKFQGAAQDRASGLKTLPFKLAQEPTAVVLSRMQRDRRSAPRWPRPGGAGGCGRWRVRVQAVAEPVISSSGASQLNPHRSRGARSEHHGFARLTGFKPRASSPYPAMPLIPGAGSSRNLPGCQEAAFGRPLLLQRGARAGRRSPAARAGRRPRG